MPAFKILDIAKVLIELKGKEDTKINVIGMRQGEKIHEVLVSAYESPYCYHYGENYYLIHREKQSLARVTFEEYNSNTKLSNRKEILELLAKGGYIRNGLPI